MTSEALAGLPAQPPSIAEWEELLVRFEIMPRALRASLDTASEAAPALTGTLAELLRREREVGRWLERASGWEPSVAEAGSPDERGLAERDLADRFSAVRARNFAMLQRRGLDVWGWSGETADGGSATVFQLLPWLLGADARALAELRESASAQPAPAGGSAC